MRKIKAHLCVHGDLQTEGVDDVFDTYVPVASWTSIHMLSILALQKHWITKQIDFSNAFIQAPLDKDVYVSLPAMFQDTNGADPKSLCLKLKKSLYDMRDAPKLWNDWLQKALDHCGFKASHEDLGIYYGHAIAIAVYVDDVLLFGPSEQEIEKVLQELQTDGFELKREKGGNDTVYNFLEINITESEGEIKLTQHGLIKKFLSTLQMEDCNTKSTPCSTTPLPTNKQGQHHSEA